MTLDAVLTTQSAAVVPEAVSGYEAAGVPGTHIVGGGRGLPVSEVMFTVVMVPAAPIMTIRD